MIRDKIKAMIISLLLKVSGISLFVLVSIFLFTPYLQAIYGIPTYIQLDFSDIDYDEAQYIKFIIDADKNFDIVLYMKDNDNNTFSVRYQMENDVATGDYKDDNNDDELAIFLDEDEYVTGHDETFNSFTHSHSLSLDEYINTHWKEHEYNGGSAELEKIRIYGDEFKLYYLAIDDGDFSDPTWEFHADDYDAKNGLRDFEDDGHTYSDITDIAFLGDYIYVTKDIVAAAGVGYEGLRYPAGFYGGYPGYGYSPWTYYGGNTGYFPPGSTYSPSGWNQPYLGGYQQPPYGYYQAPTLANDMTVWTGNINYNPYGFGYQQPYNPYGYQFPFNSYGYQPSYPYGNDFGFSPFGYQQSYNLNLDPWIWEGEPPAGWQPPLPPPGYFQLPILSNDFGGYPAVNHYVW